MFRKIEHLGIAVNNLEESLKIYEDLLKLKVSTNYPQHLTASLAARQAPLELSRWLRQQRQAFTRLLLALGGCARVYI